jgi:hypothetical protein
VFFVFFTAVMGYWFFKQKDHYNADDRDIKMDVLIADQVESHLWEPPLMRWQEPGTMNATLASAGGTAAAPAVNIGVYPPTTLSDGWTLVTPLQKFDNTNLYEKIDGGEDQFKQFGYQFLYYIVIGLPAEKLEVNVELYDMGNFKNALGIYAARRDAGTKIETHGSVYFHPTEVGVTGVVDKFYFTFAGDSANPKIMDHALKVLDDLAKAQPGGGTMPKAFGVLTNLGVDFSSIDYVPEDVFQYAFAKDFWFGKKDPKGNEQYFVHQAASADEAAKLLGQFLEELKWDYKVVSKEGQKVVLQHSVLKTFFSIEQRDAFVFGVDHAPDTDEASKSLEALAAKLFEKIS